jgi:Family of unknown function (DUF6064)
MPEWWTYGLSDLVMFSRETYYRLFELYNVAIWPAQIVAAAAAVWIGALLRRGGGSRGRVVAAALAAYWLWVAIAFHANRYATINWAASYFAAGFALEAVLLVWIGVVRGRLLFDVDGGPRRAGFWIFLFAFAVQPLAGLLFGRGWRQIEIFGVAPDPTAVGTLGILLLAAGRVRWELITIPVVWCAVSGVMLLAMEGPDAWIPLAAGAAAVFLALVISVRAADGRGSSRSTRSPAFRVL